MTYPPAPDYKYEVKQLVRLYENAIADIISELNTVDMDNFTRAHSLALLKSVGETLKELNAESTQWVETNIKLAASDGIERAILALGIVSTQAEARAIVQFSRVNTSLVKAAVADTQADLLAVTQNVDRKVRAAVRQVTAEVLRSNLPRGINSTASLRQEIVKGLRKQLGESVNTGIIDAAGRRWKPNTYAEMLVRTKMMEAHKEATINEALSRGVLYGVISAHGAKDACRYWEGRVIALDRGAPGDYPYIGDLPRREIFHPCCRHVVTPIRKPDLA